MSSLKRISDERYISMFFRNIARHKEVPVSIRYADHSMDGSMFFSRRKGNEPGIRMGSPCVNPRIGDPLEISFCNGEILFFFRSQITSVYNNIWTVKQPGVLQCSFRRRMARLRAGARETVHVAFPDRTEPYVVLDISDLGLSFLSPGPYYAPGQLCTDVRVTLDECLPVDLDGIIKHRQETEEGKYIYGMSFSRMDGEARKTLFQYVFHKAYPNLRFINETSLSCFREADSLVRGEVSRIYGGTFWGGPVVTLPGKIKDPAAEAEVYAGLCDYLLHHPDFEFFISCLQPDKHWTLDYFQNMASIIGNSEKFALDTLQYLECNGKETESFSLPAGYVCCFLKNPDEFLAFCSKNMHSLERKCYAYGEEVPDMERAIWRVSRKEAIQAYVVADGFSRTDKPGQCRIYFSTPSPQADAVIKAFLPEVASFFRDRQRNSFQIYIHSWDSPLREMKIPGIRYLYPVGRILADRRGILEFKKLLVGEVVGAPGIYPLTHPQLAIWNTEKMYPGTNLGNITGLVRIQGELDPVALEHAINLVVETNPGLRIRVTEEGGEPRQYVAGYRHIRPDIIGQLENWDEYKAAKPFQLLENDLFYFAIFYTAPRKGGFYIKTHHILSDAWTSSNLLISKIMEYYVRLREEKLVVPEAPSYIDYVLADAEGVNGKTFLESRDFWLSRFETIPEMTCYRPIAPAHRNTAAERKTFILSGALSEEIRQFCKTGKFSPLTLFLSILGIYMSRVTSKTDLVIGSPVLNRSNQREKETAGMFVNMAPMRLSIPQEQPFISFIDRVFGEWRQILKNQKYPYQMILKDFRERHSISGSLYDVVISYQNSSHRKLEADYDVEWVFNGNQADSLAIHISDRENEGSFTMEYDYLSVLFTGKEIDAMHCHMMELLQDALKHPEKEVARLKLLQESEREKLFSLGRGPMKEYPRLPVRALFEAQAEKTPEAAAVVFGDQTLSYRELNEKANSLARVLRGKGAGPGNITAVMVERSLELMIGILGVLKAGGAYLPIDPEYPEERKALLLKDSGAGILITCGGISEGMQSPCEVIDLWDKEIYRENSQNPENVNTPEDLLYMIYTSGTTGKPKGAMVTNDGFVNLLDWYTGEFQIASRDRVLLLASHSFDLAQKNLFAPLIRGGQLCIFTPGFYDYGKLSETIEARRISILNCTPSAFYPLLDSNRDTGFRRLQSLRYVFLGGEPIHAGRLADWLESPLCGCGIVNTYGPTECTDIASAYVLRKSDSLERMSIPIGKPIQNVGIYILDHELNPVPPGGSGELCIGGTGVGKGYFRAQEMTEKKFVPTPHLPDMRIYKTGDLARWLPDGNIEFLGRVDQQVKIRGFRIELGEIEHCLLQCAQIKEAIVVPVEDARGNISLCAYYTAQQSLKPSELRRELMNILPGYMIPSSFVRMDQIPLTPNGKVDRRALPPPVYSGQDGEAFARPENKIQERLSEMWKDILGIGEIGIQDNFFELGGDSLKAITLAARIQKEMGADIPVSALFELQTVKALAACLQDPGQGAMPPILPAEEKEYYPAASSQKRMFLLQQMESGSVCYNMPGMMMLDGVLDKEQLESVLYRLIERHWSLRTSFLLIDGEIVQKISPCSGWMLESKICGEAAIGTEIKAFIRPFDLARAPLIRFLLLEIRPDRHVLLFDMHHIISDGVSMGILFQEMSALYSGQSLTDIRIQYRDYAVWQQEFLASGRLREQEKYWLGQFENEYPVLQLPTDFPRSAAQISRGAWLRFRGDKRLTAGLRALGDRVGATLNMVLLAGLSIVLSRYSNQEDLIIGIPAAGRSHPDLEGVVGMFVNSLAVRNKPEGQKTVVQFLGEVRENQIRVLENQDYPLERLVDQLQVEREWGRNPLFDVMLVCQQEEKYDFALPGLKMSLQELEPAAAKFDIALQAAPAGDEIKFKLEYSAGLFKESTMMRFGAHLLQVLTEMVRNPHYRLTDLDMLPAQEKERLLYEFNRTKADYEKEMTIQALFEAQAARTPDHPAVISGEQQLTYRELNEKADSLARALRRKGVGRDTIVAVLSERGIPLVVGVLGVLKAGGAYLPLDPQYSGERMDYMLGDSGALVLLTQKALREKVRFHGEVMELDSMQWTPEEDEKLSVSSHPSNLAYVIYTSGSTGKPKGVMAEHKGIASLKSFWEERLGIRASDRIVQFSSISFDASVWEIFMTLLNGASLYLLKREQVSNYTLFEEFIQANKITVATLPPAYLQHLRPDCVTALRLLITAGEAIPPDLWRTWAGKVKMVNAYGPTEASICATAWIHEGERDFRSVPIGKPIFNARVYILDDAQHLVPVGVPGELCIAGDLLARGYLRQPELTEEKFIPHPYSPSEKLYRTGDLARWLEDGNIEFLGRVDHQVKIRGFRIEPGEIEAHIRKHKDVEDAVVIPRDVGGKACLCAYVVWKGKPAAEEVKKFLRQALPDYMVPAYMLAISEVPLNTSGKVDKYRLPHPEQDEKEFLERLPPRNEVDSILKEAWKEALNGQELGIADNFFSKGADSLAVMRVLTSTYARGWNLGMQDFYRYQTIQSLSDRITEVHGQQEKEDEKGEILEIAEIKSICSEIPPDLGSKRREYGNVLLTGATGYLGAHILESLLKNSGACVNCLVRGGDRHEAEKKLKSTLAFYFGGSFHGSFQDRISVIPADITRTGLGVSVDAYDRLAGETDLIIHAAALVKHFGEYTQFRKVNVKGTEQMIQLALQGHVRLVHISTMSVSGNLDPSFEKDVVFDENTFYFQQNYTDNVYVKSKFEAENLVLKAVDAGLDAMILRVGNLTGRYSDGCFQINMETNRFYNALKSILSLGVVGSDMKEKMLEFTPVDICGKAVAELAFSAPAGGRVFHLYNHRAVPMETALKMFKSHGHEIRMLDEQAFFAFMEAASTDEKKKELVWGIIHDLGKPARDGKTRIIPRSAMTQRYLEQLGLHWPEISGGYMGKVLGHMKSRGFI